MSQVTSHRHHKHEISNTLLKLNAIFELINGGDLNPDEVHQEVIDEIEKLKVDWDSYIKSI